jgi:hypothetical protein
MVQATVNDISLWTVPNLRAFAKDTFMNVLYFMSPQHHDLILDIVLDFKKIDTIATPSIRNI